jgi:hypothetical protein
VPDPGVAEIVEERARQVAKQAGMSVRQVLEHADPQQLAAGIAEVIDQGEFSVRPPRDTVPIEIAVSRLPALIGGLSEAGKLAASKPAVARPVHGDLVRVCPLLCAQPGVRGREVVQVDAAPVAVDAGLPGAAIAGGAADVRREDGNAAVKQALVQGRSRGVPAIRGRRGWTAGPGTVRVRPGGAAMRGSPCRPWPGSGSAQAPGCWRRPGGCR